MSDLNVALILRLVDRMSGPSRAAAAALGGVAKAERDVADGAKRATGATDAASKATAVAGRTAEVAAVATGRQGAAGRLAAAGVTAAGRAYRAAGVGFSAGARSAQGGATSLRSYSAGARLAATAGVGLARAQTATASAARGAAASSTVAAASTRAQGAAAKSATAVTDGLGSALQVSAGRLTVAADAARTVASADVAATAAATGATAGLKGQAAGAALAVTAISGLGGAQATTAAASRTAATSAERSRAATTGAGRAAEAASRSTLRFGDTLSTAVVHLTAAADAARTVASADVAATAAATGATAGLKGQAAGAALAATAVSGLGRAQAATGAASRTAATSAERSAAATTGAGRAAEAASSSTRRLGDTMGATVIRLTTHADSARAAATADAGLARAEEAAGQAAAGAARRFDLLERAQIRGRAAVRMLRSETERFHHSMGKLAMTSLAVEGVAPAAHAMTHMVGHSIGEASTFSSGMTGFGITAELSDRAMLPIRDAVLQAASRYALAPEQALETFAFTRRSGVFTKPAEIVAAGNEASRFQKLAERMGSPVTGEEVAGGASSAVREYEFAANAPGIRKYFAMLDAAEKTGGGMKISDLLQYSRSAGGMMKSFGAGSAAGLADVLAGQQVSMYLAHTGGQAGINFQDLLANITHKSTVKRFAHEGVDLPAVLRAGQLAGQTPVETFARLVDKMTAGKQGTDKANALGHLLVNQQAAQSMMALIQNLPKFLEYRNTILKPTVGKQYDHDVSRATSGPSASLERLKVAQMRMQIAMGTILLPVAGRVADALERVAGWMTRVQEHGGRLGKAAVFAVAGLAGLLMGTVALGHAFVAIAAPILTVRFLLGRGLPLGARAATGALAGLARGLGGAGGAAAGLGARLVGLANGAMVAVWSGARRLTVGTAQLAARGFGAARRGAIAFGGRLMAMARGGLPAVAAGARAVTARLGQMAAAGFMGAIGRVRAFGGAMVALATRGIPAAILGLGEFSAAVWASTIALLANPATWIFVATAAAIAGVVALIVGAAVLIHKYWQPLKAFFGGLWGGFVEGLRPLAPLAHAVGGGIARAFAPLRPVWNAVVGGARAVWHWITRLLTPVRLSAAEFTKTSNAGRAVGLMLGGLVVAAVRFVTGLPGRLARAAVGFGRALFSVGRQLAQGLIDGVLSGRDPVGAAVVAVTRMALGGALRVLAPNRATPLTTRPAVLEAAARPKAPANTSWIDQTQKGMGAAAGSVERWAGRQADGVRRGFGGAGRAIGHQVEGLRRHAARLASGLAYVGRGARSWIGGVGRGLAEGFQPATSALDRGVQRVASRWSAATGRMAAAGRRLRSLMGAGVTTATATAGRAASGLGERLRPVREAGAAVGAWVGRGRDAASAALGRVQRSVEATAGALAARFRPLAEIGRRIGTALTQGFNEALAWLRRTGGAVAAWIGRLFAPRNAAEAGRGFGRLLAAIIQAPFRLIGSLFNLLSSLPGRFTALGGAIVRGLGRGLVGAAAGLRANVVGLGSGVVNWFKGRLGIHSPSRVFAELGSMVVAGLDLGIGHAAPRPARTVRALARRMVEAAQGAISGMADRVGRIALANPPVRLPPQPRVVLPPAPRLRVAPPAGRRPALARAPAPPRAPPLRLPPAPLPAARRATALAISVAAPASAVARPEPQRLVALVPAGQPASRPAEPGRAAGRGAQVERLEQHFHIAAPSRGGQVDHRALARELHRQSRHGLDAALHDGGDDL